MKWSMICVLPISMLVVSLSFTSSVGAKGNRAAYQTGFTSWHAAQGNFLDWALAGAQLDPNGALVFNPQGAQTGSDPAGVYNGKNFYNGAGYSVGEATSPVVSTAFAFTQAIVSWNVSTPPGAWIETLIRVEIGGRYTKWYNLGVWESGNAAVERHSVAGQGDSDGFVAVDTLILSAKKIAGATAFQVKLRLFSADGSASPVVRNLSAAYSNDPPKKKTAASAGNPGLWGTLLEVPECSQMVYPDGGEVWCSPTSTSMVLAYWQNDAGPCEPRVRAAVAGVYDWIYDGHGNWPFNTAYAAAQSAGDQPLEAYVARFTDLAEVEKWIAAGVPVVASFAWGKGDLTGAAIPSSNGHLAVIVGFDASGNPIVNDPAAADDPSVRRTYLRDEFEAQWLTTSGGTVYLIYPEGWLTP